MAAKIAITGCLTLQAEELENDIIIWFQHGKKNIYIDAQVKINRNWYTRKKLQAKNSKRVHLSPYAITWFFSSKLREKIENCTASHYQIKSIIYPLFEDKTWKKNGICGMCLLSLWIRDMTPFLPVTFTCDIYMFLTCF